MISKNPILTSDANFIFAIANPYDRLHVRAVNSPEELNKIDGHLKYKLMRTAEKIFMGTFMVNLSQNIQSLN